MGRGLKLRARGDRDRRRGVDMKEGAAGAKNLRAYAADFVPLLVLVPADVVAARVDDEAEVRLEDAGTAVAADHVVLEEQRARAAVLAAREDDACALRRAPLQRVPDDRVVVDLQAAR